MVGQRGSGQRKLKASIDKCTNEMNTLTSKLPTLTSKGYPEAMVAWCSEKISAVQAHISVAQDTYTLSLTWTVPPDADIALLEEDTLKCEKALIELQDQHKNWKDKEVDEVSKLLG